MPGGSRQDVAVKSPGKAMKAALSRSREVASEELDELLGSLSDKVADVRSALASAAEDGADAIGDGVDSLVKKSKKGVRALNKRWQKLDRKQKVAIAGGLLAMLAAAAATPAVVRRVQSR